MILPRVFKTNRPAHTVWVEFPEGTAFEAILDARDTFRAEFPRRVVNVFGIRVERGARARIKDVAGMNGMTVGALGDLAKVMSRAL